MVNHIMELTRFIDIRVAAARNSRRLRSWTFKVIFFPRISSIVSDNLVFRAWISMTGARCGGSLSNLS